MDTEYELRRLRNDILRRNRFITILRKYRALFTEVEALIAGRADSTIDALTSFSERLHYEIRLRDEESSLPRELAVLLRVDGTKQLETWEKRTIHVTFDYAPDLRIIVTNYRPAVCELVEEEVDVPASRKKIFTLRCTPETLTSVPHAPA